MAERKAWSKQVIIALTQQDQALTNIIQVKNIKKWTAISKAMETEYKIFGRTNKQCRQRWHNQLDPSINNTEWTLEQQKILFENHNKFGNKWARISEQLQGRTDNCVKNHFYSTLRRAMKRLNVFVAQYKSKYNFKELKPMILTKLIAAFSDKFDRKLKLDSSIINKSLEIKNRLVNISKIQQNTSQSQIELRNITKDIIEFNKSYKRKKTKKAREVSDESDDFPEIVNPFANISHVSEVDQSGIIPFQLQLETSVLQYHKNINIEKQKQKPPEIPSHTNLFTFTPCQIITSSREVSQAKESFGAIDLVRKPSSKIISEDGQSDIPLLKKRSGYSSWSMNIMQLPLREKVSELSLDRMNSDIYEFNSTPNYNIKNLFGCDLEQLEN